MGLGSGIRDPRSGIRKKPIPDPGSGSATLQPGQAKVVLGPTPLVLVIDSWALDFFLLKVVPDYGFDIFFITFNC
jgi:hypothetical protein